MSAIGAREEVTVGVLIKAIDENLKGFFQRPNIVQAVKFVADALLKTPVIRGEQADELTKYVKDHLTKDDLSAVKPHCL